MATLMFRKFTHTHVLKACGVDLLEQFFDRFRASISDEELVFPVPGKGEKAANEYYRAVLQIFRDPERLPDDLCEVLYQIDGLSASETADRLTSVAAAEGIVLQTEDDPTGTEVALQIWMAKPDVFKKEYDSQKLINLRTFTKFLSDDCGPMTFQAPTTKQLAEVSDAMLGWFKKYHRGEDLWITFSEMNGEWWFVLEHGERVNRTGTIENRQRKIRRLRPATDDVLVYDPTTNAIRVCAGSTGVKRQFRDAFGLVFFGTKKYFDKEEVYRFEPICEDPDTALDPEGLKGIEEIRLVEIRYFNGGKFNEVVTRHSKDVVAMFQGRQRPLPDGNKVHRMCFEVIFEGDEKPRPVKITSRSTIQIARECDHGLVHAWLRLRKIELASGEDADAAKK